MSKKTTSNPAFTERNIQKPHAYLLNSRPEQNLCHVSHSTVLVRMCLACQHVDFNSADWISDNLHVITRTDICEQWERKLSFGSVDVRGAGTRDEPLRTSAWEATLQ